MNNPGYIIEAKFKTDSYDYITGNSDFYKFLGERLYTTFDSLVADGLPALERAIAERSYGKPFILDVYMSDGQTRTMVCRLMEQDDPDCVFIRMTELEMATDKYLSFETERLEINALLSQHNCVYYSYDCPSDTITCYRYDGKRKDLCRFSLGEFRNVVADMLSDLSEIERFTGNLKNGTRNFSGVFSCASPVVISGAAIYNDGVHIRTVGTFTSGSGGRVGPAHDLSRRRDQLTGLILKEDISNYAKRSIGELKRHTVLAIIDIDDFKFINDRRGHAMGDAVLKKCSAIIERETQAYGKAGRIGGDEFLVVFDNISDNETLRYVLRAIKNNILEAYSEERDGFKVTISIGAAEYPKDAGDYDTLFRLTDYLLYRAKHKGKNRYIFYDPAKHGSVEDILSSSIEDAGRIVGRKGLSKAEVVCRIVDMLICGSEYSPDSVIKDISEHFGIERIMLYDKTSRTAVIRCGTDLPDDSVIAGTVDYIFDEELSRRRKDGVTIVNNVETFAFKSPELYEKLRRQGIYSFMHREITGKSGKSYIMSCESVSALLTWNLEDMRFFRILDRVLASAL